MARRTAKKSTAKAAVESARDATGDETLTTPPDQPNEEAALQFPAAVGEPEVEVAERSQDVTEPATLTHRKDFVLLKREFETNADTKAGADGLHRANIEATRQYLISQGLRPTGDGKFAGKEDHPDGVSVILHYDVPVTPAVTATVDDEGETVVHAHVTLDDQHDAEEATS